MPAAEMGRWDGIVLVPHAWAYGVTDSAYPNLGTLAGKRWYLSVFR